MKLKIPVKTMDGEKLDITLKMYDGVKKNDIFSLHIHLTALTIRIKGT
jgi:hypothetical protein